MAQPRDFGFGSDETLVRDQARKLLRDEAPVDRLRTLVAGDHRVAYESDVPPVAWNEGLWGEMVKLGWPALLVPEAAGGLGMKMVAVAAVGEEIGRAAVPSPLPATLCATAVLRAAGSSAHDALGRIAAGAAATLAVAGRNGSWESADVPVERAADGALTGEAWFVQDARKASLLVVASRGQGGVQLHVVAADAPGVTVLPDRIVDLTRDQARVRFDGRARRAGRGRTAPLPSTPPCPPSWCSWPRTCAGPPSGSSRRQPSTPACGRSSTIPSASSRPSSIPSST